jgi:hypothetical protein
MNLRTSVQTVTFQFPFDVAALGGPQPAGDYLVETDEEMLSDLSFPVYRRIRTLIRVSCGPAQTRLVEIEPGDLLAALARDKLPRAGSA